MCVLGLTWAEVLQLLLHFHVKQQYTTVKALESFGLDLIDLHKLVVSIVEAIPKDTHRDEGSRV